jgi:phospholipid/cholesterol/gamma-HCH transport system ATP-binding protein
MTIRGPRRRDAGGSGRAIHDPALDRRAASRVGSHHRGGNVPDPTKAPPRCAQLMLFSLGCAIHRHDRLREHRSAARAHNLPEELIRDLVLVKLHAVGLRGTAYLMPSELSGGMARRVALARAIALDPMLIMYDEPFAGLDPISLGVVGQMIRRLNDALGITSVVVTHDVYESLKIVDYMYFVSEGKIVAEGTPEEVRASTDTFVRQFVDGAPDGPVPFHYPATPYRSELFARV